MHIVSQMNPDLYARARQRQSELWDRIINLLSGEWERSWSPTWRVDPAVLPEEVMEDLNHGRG
ncbi:MAG: hypothetical protein WBM48_20120 [Polyangiales bacterium]